MTIELPVAPPEWMMSGPCSQADPEAWYPEKGGSTRVAKSICWTRCPVREQCLAYALDHDERFGVWGGHSERERHRLKRGETVKPFIKPALDPIDCKHCGQPFEPQHQSQTFCSRTCARLNDRPAATCVWCGSEFKADHHKQRYCSKEHAREARRVHWRENSQRTRDAEVCA